MRAIECQRALCRRRQRGNFQKVLGRRLKEIHRYKEGGKTATQKRGGWEMCTWVIGAAAAFTDISLLAPMCYVIRFPCVRPLRSLHLHCTPLSTLVGDHIWLEPASGTPTMLCKIVLHQPLMAFEEVWLLTTRDSWIAPERRRGYGKDRGGEATRGSSRSISTAALWAWPDHHATWFFLASIIHFHYKNYHQGKRSNVGLKHKKDGLSWQNVKSVICTSKGLEGALDELNKARAEWKSGPGGTTLSQNLTCTEPFTLMPTSQHATMQYGFVWPPYWQWFTPIVCEA